MKASAGKLNMPVAEAIEKVPEAVAEVMEANRLRTPPLDTPVLPGITRALVIELARQAGIEADEGPCTVEDLLGADELFLTNAIMEVMPVTRVEQKAIGDEKPGPITKQLAAAYREPTALVEA